METKSVKNIFLVGLKLLLICAVVAGIVSFVYSVTLEPYAENIENTKREAVEGIFGESGLTLKELDEGVWQVSSGTKTLGYCARGVGGGFNGDVEVMVGYDVTCAIIGVSVISNQETPGVGSKALEPSYLANYIGWQGELTLGFEVDAVSGATYSSRGVIAGVNDATSRLLVVLGTRGLANE